MADSDKTKTIGGFAYWIENEENGVCYIPLILCKKIMELLKEQESKPVELHTNAYGTKFYFCPKCKRELFHTRNLNFCERCGQAVTWDGK